MDWPALGDWIIKVGIPSAMGVFLVVYLVRYIIPQHLAAFSKLNDDTRADFIKALIDQRTDFISTLKEQRDDHLQKMELVTSAHTDGDETISATLHDLSVEIAALRQAVARVEGVIAGKATRV